MTETPDTVEQLRVATVRLLAEVGRLSVWVRTALIRSLTPQHDALHGAVAALHVLIAGPTAAELDTVVTRLVASIAVLPAACRPTLAEVAVTTSQDEQFPARGLMRAFAAIVGAIDRYVIQHAEIAAPNSGGTMTTTPDRSSALQAAVDELAAAEDALGIVERLQMAQQTLAAGHDDNHPPEAREFWLALHVLINSGATPGPVDRLVSTLEVCGPELRQALVIAARCAVTDDAPRAAVWQALQNLADAVVE